VTPSIPVPIPFLCQRCGQQYATQVVQCSSCGGDEVKQATPRGREPEVLHFSKIPAHDDAQRHKTGIEGFDEVLGGGLVDDSIVLIAGEPGRGKSTIVLMAAVAFARRGVRVLYVSSEEGTAQLKARSNRMELDTEYGEEDFPLWAKSTGSLEEVDRLISLKNPDIILVDSINRFETMHASGGAGSLQQSLAVTSRLCTLAKREVRSVILVGHVNSEGEIAGPKALQHLVDAVLDLGADDAGRRFFVARKNRYGATGEATWWEMTARGLIDAGDPSIQLLARTSCEPGVVFLADATLAKPQLVRIEAQFNPEKGDIQVRGIASSRVKSVLKLLRAHSGLTDEEGVAIEVGTVLGQPCEDTGLDLALAVALLSAHLRKPVPWPSMAFGRLSVRGRIEPCDRDYPRLEAARTWGLRSVLASRWTRSPEEMGLVRVRKIDRLEEIGGWLTG
jgi:DNA repair protein RadA/Sms